MQHSGERRMSLDPRRKQHTFRYIADLDQGGAALSLPLGHDDPLLLYGYTTATREAQRNSFPAAIFAFEARLPTSNLVARGVWTSPPTSHSSGVSSQRRIRGNERIVRRFRDAVVRRRWRRLHHHGDAGRCATC